MGSQNSIYSRYIKRLIDIVMSLVALVLLATPMLLIAILIKLTSKGRIIFKQKRIGRNNNLFTIYKFRTMSTDAPHDSSPYEFHDAHKYITKIGRALRKTSLDELPQLFNIIKGDMSLVGPRPAGINDIERTELRTKLNVHTIRPGLTGWAQVNGRDSISEARKAELDAEYLNNMSIFFDIKCALRTIPVIFGKIGNVEGGEIMDNVAQNRVGGIVNE